MMKIVKKINQMYKGADLEIKSNLRKIASMLGERRHIEINHITLHNTNLGMKLGVSLKDFPEYQNISGPTAYSQPMNIFAQNLKIEENGSNITNDVKKAMDKNEEILLVPELADLNMIQGTGYLPGLKTPKEKEFESKHIKPTVKSVGFKSKFRKR